MPGDQAHPQPRVQVKKAHELVTTGSPNIPAFPARWFYGFLRALSGDRALLSPSPADHSANLMPASRHQDHTTSPSATGAVRPATPTRPSHPAPNVRDDRPNAPLTSTGWRGLLEMICPTGERNIFSRRACASAQIIRGKLTIRGHPCPVRGWKRSCLSARSHRIFDPMRTYG